MVCLFVTWGLGLALHVADLPWVTCRSRAFIHFLYCTYVLIYSCQCLMFFCMCILFYVLNTFAHEHCVTRKCFVRPHYLSSPQAPRSAGFGRPNARQGITKCRAPDFSNKCRHPFGVQTAWAQIWKWATLVVRISAFIFYSMYVRKNISTTPDWGSRSHNTVLYLIR